MHLSQIPIGTGEAGPPSANRGVAPQTHSNKYRTGVLEGCEPGRIHIDYLTYTLRSDRAASVLAARGEFAKSLTSDGGASQGFRQSEQHACLGGMHWRKFDPVSESKIYGLDYESWDCSGDGSSGLADELVPVPGYASRVDIAFDFFGDNSIRTTKPEHLIMPSVDPKTDSDDPSVKLKTRQGFIVGFSGEGGCNTGYIGSKKSDRRVRIYRKDLESKSFADWLGPCLRVELVLRGEHAKAFFELYRTDREAAFRAAAAHIEEMMGFNPYAGGEVPAIEKPEELSIADTLFQFVNQYASTITAYEDAGIDLRALCRAKVDRQSKWAGKRLEALRARLKPLDPDVLVHRVMGMIVKRARRKPT